MRKVLLDKKKITRYKKLEFDNDQILFIFQIY